MRLAVIPARGGSKRIPRKNIKRFNGKPILAYAIDAARATGLFDHILVSTDDEELAHLALDDGKHSVHGCIPGRGGITKAGALTCSSRNWRPV